MARLEGFQFGPAVQGFFPGSRTSPQTVSQIKARVLLAKDQRELAKNTEAGARKAVENYAQVAHLDPHSAPAQVGLAEAYTILWSFGLMSRQEVI